MKKNIILLSITLIVLVTGCNLFISSLVMNELGEETSEVIDIAEIPGVTAPAIGETPVTEITDTAQYTGTVSWEPDDDPFEHGTKYTATITLTAKDEYTLSGVEENFFTIDGTDSVSNDADSGVVTAVFPATKYALGDFDIGDDGPANGIIFCVDTADEHDWIYLEVAPASTEWTDKEWGDYGTEISGDAALTGIGDGQAATTAIVQHLADNTSETGRAAQLCDGLKHEHEGTTYKDWFLPSKDELYAIWDNIVDDGSGSNSGVGGFANEGYWSSSELDSDYAWGQVFSSALGGGYQDGGYKSNDGRVRAVRAF